MIELVALHATGSPSEVSRAVFRSCEVEFEAKAVIQKELRGFAWVDAEGPGLSDSLHIAEQFLATLESNRAVQEPCVDVSEDQRGTGSSTRYKTQNHADARRREIVGDAFPNESGRPR